MKWWLVGACSAWGLTSKAPPDPSKVALPVVPSAKNVGKDGFPELPSLEDIMNPAAKTMSGISTRAKELEAKMMTLEKENAAKLERQKKVFDRKLKEQEEKNQVEAEANAKLAKSIMQLKKQNEDVFSQSRRLQKAIFVRQREVKHIQDQLTSLQKFLSDALGESDEGKVAELKVLELEEQEEEKEVTAAQEKRKVESYINIAERQVQSQGLSFLAISEDEEPAEKEPESLLNVLAEGVKDMKQQGEASSKHLQSLFRESLEDGVKRHKALVEQQSVLNQTLKGMTSYEERLAKAEAHLKETKSKLDRSLHDAGLFLQKLSQLTLAKPEDSLKALSKGEDL